ncbi:MAG TPA: hypothetical protein VGI10_15400 [Polyangiaceae bacterium]
MRCPLVWLCATLVACGCAPSARRADSSSESESHLELQSVLGCWHVAGQRYEDACFANDRGFLRMKSGGWDGFALSWQRLSREAFWSPVPALGSELAVSSVEGHGGRRFVLSFASSPEELRIVAGLVLVRVSADEERELRARIAALPDVHTACERARQCVAAANALLNPPPADDAAPPPVVASVAITGDDSLLQCSDARAQALTFLAARKLVPPEACR